MKKNTTLKTLLQTTSHAIFWLWNLTFLLVVYFGILPQIGVDLVGAIFSGEIETEFLLPLVGLIAVPTYHFGNKEIQPNDPRKCICG